MSEGATQPPAAKPRQRIWLWVLLATAIACAIAGTVAAFSGDESTDPERFRTLGRDWAMGAEAAFAFGIPAAATLVVWLIFCAFIFRRRAPIWKWFVALVVMLPIVTLVAVPLRIYSFDSAVARDDQQLAAWHERVKQRTQALRHGIAGANGMMQGDLDFEDFRTPAELQATLERLRGARTRYTQYRDAINAEVARARTELARMDVFEGSREDAEAYLDHLTRADVQRHFALTIQLFDENEQKLLFLQSHPNTWTIMNDHLTFYNAPVMGQFDHIMEQISATRTNLDRLEGALHTGEDAEGPN